MANKHEFIMRFIMWFYNGPRCQMYFDWSFKAESLASFKISDHKFNFWVLTYRGWRSRDIGLYELLKEILSFSPVFFGYIWKLYDEAPLVKMQLFLWHGKGVSNISDSLLNPAILSRTDPYVSSSTVLLSMLSSPSRIFVLTLYCVPGLEIRLLKYFIQNSIIACNLLSIISLGKCA